MTWIYIHRNIFRLTIFALAILAILEPWWYDLIVVPAKYPCSSPVIRLKGDYCGVPMPASWIIINFTLQAGVYLVSMIKGSLTPRESADAIRFIVLYFSFLLLFIMPLFSTWLLILGGDRKRRQIFQIVAWGVSACVGVLWVIEISRTQWPWALWGIWLFILVAIIGLIFELLILALGRKREEGNETKY